MNRARWRVGVGEIAVYPLKIRQWNDRTMYETGKCAQVVSEVQRFKLGILGTSEMMWNGCGKKIYGSKKTYGSIAVLVILVLTKAVRE